MIDERYILELGSEAAGTLVGGPHGFTFHASAPWAWPLDGLHYPDIQAATHAIAGTGQAQGPDTVPARRAA